MTEVTKKQLRFRQLKALSLVAAGSSMTSAAQETGYCRSHLSRLAHSEAGREELARLRQEVETEIMKRLPAAFQLVLDQLIMDLHSKSPWIRREAGTLLLRTFGREMVRFAAILETAGTSTSTTKRTFNHGQGDHNDDDSNT